MDSIASFIHSNFYSKKNHFKRSEEIPKKAPASYWGSTTNYLHRRTLRFPTPTQICRQVLKVTPGIVSNLTFSLSPFIAKQLWITAFGEFPLNFTSEESKNWECLFVILRVTGVYLAVKSQVKGIEELKFKALMNWRVGEVIGYSIIYCIDYATKNKYLNSSLGILSFSIFGIAMSCFGIVETYTRLPNQELIEALFALLQEGTQESWFEYESVILFLIPHQVGNFLIMRDLENKDSREFLHFHARLIKKIKFNEYSAQNPLKNIESIQLRLKQLSNENRILLMQNLLSEKKNELEKDTQGVFKEIAALGYHVWSVYTLEFKKAIEKFKSMDLQEGAQPSYFKKITAFMDE